jgi:hypothetical protein
VLLLNVSKDAAGRAGGKVRAVWCYGFALCQLGVSTTLLGEHVGRCVDSVHWTHTFEMIASPSVL